MKKLDLLNNVNLFLEPNDVNNGTYVFIAFTGGQSVEKKSSLAHLVEHALLEFDVDRNGQRVSNDFVSSLNAGGRTEKNFIGFHFVALDAIQIREKLNALAESINNVIIDEKALEDEKKIILLEKSSSMNLTKHHVDLLDKITTKDIKSYIKQNITLKNLQLCVISNIDEGMLKSVFSEFVNSLPRGKTENYVEETINTTAFDILKYQFPKKEKVKERVENKQFISVKPNSKNNPTVKYSYTIDVDDDDKETEIKIRILHCFIKNYRQGIRKFLRRDKKLVYNATSKLNMAENQWSINIVAETIDKAFKPMLKSLNSWIKRITTDGITEKEFRSAVFDFIQERHLKVTDKNIPMDVVAEIEYARNLDLEEFNDFIYYVLNYENLGITYSGNVKEIETSRNY